MPRKTVQRLRASVIIPAYNAEKTLQACIDGLMQQTRIPDEIIVVDDGSEDRTKTIAEAYSLVTLLSQKNQGPAKARNVGAQNANGDVIVFLDSDCVPEKNWLEELLKPFANEKVVGVQGAYKTRQTSVVAQFDQADIEYRYERMKRAKKLDWIGSYSAAYLRKIFLEEKGFDETFPKASGEDAELSYRLAEKGFVLVFAPNAIVYHTHPAHIIHYLYVKFFRAYWRMRMYIKYPQKVIGDSYTPNNLKYSVVLALLTFFLTAGTIIFPAWGIWAVACVLGFFVLFSCSFSPAKLGIVLWATGFILYFFRSIIFAAGLISGFLDRRVWA